MPHATGCSAPTIVLASSHSTICGTAASLPFLRIKALLSLPGRARQPDDAVIYDYLSANLLDHTQETFFTGIAQLPAAH